MFCLIGFYCNRSATSPNLIFRGKVATPIGYILIYIINKIAMMEAANRGHSYGKLGLNFDCEVSLTRSKIGETYREKTMAGGGKN